jgi:hypothetical protein
MTARGLHEATTSTAAINKWWANNPEANIAIRTGAISGIWVLDLDGEEGIAAVAELEEIFGQLPLTPTVITGRGGRHYYFKIPPGVVIKPTVKLGNKPVDVRGDGSYVVAPPSNHISGNDYSWSVSPTDATLAEAPTWLIDIVTKKVDWPGGQPKTKAPVLTMPSANRRTLRVQEDNAIETAHGAAQGERHSKALQLIGSGLARGMASSEVEEQALAWASKCNPPMPSEEVKRIVADLSQKHQVAQAAALVWDPPVPFYDFDPPAFPTEALPQWLKLFVEAEAKATQTPPDMVGMLVLSTVAAASAKKVEVVVKDGYIEPVNIFTVSALPPANRKSAVFTDVTKPLRDFEESEIKRLKPAIAEATTKLKIKETSLDKLQNEAAKAKPEEATEAVRKATDLAKEIAEAVPPVLPRFIAADTTPEKLAILLAENNGRMAVMSPEGDVFDLMAGRYGSKGAANFGVYLNGHAGDDLRVDRVNREGEFVKKPALTLGLVVQPDVIRGLADKQGFRGRGLLARFLYCVPISLVGRRKADPPVVPITIREGYNQKIHSLLRLGFDKDEKGQQRSYCLHLSPEAKELYLAFAKWVEPQLAEGGQLGNVDDWAGKLVGAVIRLAGILHMAEHAGDATPWNHPITSETLERAIGIGQYLIPHAKAAFAQMSVDPVIEDAKFVLRWIERQGFSSFTERDAFEGTKSRFKKMANLRPALGILVEHGFIRQVQQVPPSGPGRRPSPTFEVNPQSHSHMSHKAHFQGVKFDSANNATLANGLALSNNQPAPAETANAGVSYEEGVL